MFVQNGFNMSKRLVGKPIFSEHTFSTDEIKSCGNIGETSLHFSAIGGEKKLNL